MMSEEREGYQVGAAQERNWQLEGYLQGIGQSITMPVNQLMALIRELDEKVRRLEGVVAELQKRPRDGGAP